MCASITCEKKTKKERKRKHSYICTQNSGKKAFMCIYTREKKKREKGKIKSRYICTPKKGRKEKMKTPVYMHTKLLEETACVHLYRGKEKRKKRRKKMMRLYLHTKRGCVCSYNSGKKDERKDEKAGSPLSFCIAFLHFFALQMYAPLTRRR